MNTLNTKTHSSKEIAEFSFENADVKSGMKSNLSLSSEYRHEAVCAVHIFHVTPTQLLWNGVVHDIKC